MILFGERREVPALYLMSPEDHIANILNLGDLFMFFQCELIHAFMLIMLHLGHGGDYGAVFFYRMSKTWSW